MRGGAKSLPTYRFFTFRFAGPLRTAYPVSMIEKHYIGYYRVSTKMQGLDGNGMAAQKETVRRFVESQGGVLAMEFSEVETGKKTSDERPQLAAALDYAKKNKGTVVIAKLDRLARNAEFLLRLQNSGADFIACDAAGCDQLHGGCFGFVGATGT